jgi:hypothetical protein
VIVAVWDRAQSITLLLQPVVELTAHVRLICDRCLPLGV